MTAQSCLCTPGHHSGGAGCSQEGLQRAQRLPVIIPEELGILMKRSGSSPSSVNGSVKPKGHYHVSEASRESRTKHISIGHAKGVAESLKAKCRGS
jgi:hypothetical protein